MKDTEKLIIIPKPDYKLFYLLLFIICSLTRYLVPRFLEKDIKKKEIEAYYKGKSYFDILSNFIADFLTGIIILINKCNKDNSSKISSIQGLRTKKEMNHKFFFYLSSIALIDFLAQLCLSNFLFSYIVPNEMINNHGKFLEEEDLYFVVFIDISSRYIFSRIFLKSYFYCHHYVSMVITSLGFIPLVILNLANFFENDVQYKYIFLIQNVFMTVIYSLEDVLNKICLNQLILRPYELMFYKAAFQIILLITITTFDFKALMEYTKIVFNWTYVFYRFSFIFSNIIRTWSLITIIELINPNHLSVLKSSEFTFLFISYLTISSFKIVDHDISTSIIVVGIICFLFSIIGSIIHNEIIIINKFGLLECTDYYKIEMKGFHGNDEDLEDKKNTNEKDSLLTDSIDNE
jgi:hypothetical protein